MSDQSQTDPLVANLSAITLPALFLKFLRFGMLAFGGPVAQIAMIREALVTRERWVEPDRFNRLLAVLQILPGPEAHELCVHLGMVARGRIGGVLAGLGFMLPGFLLMLGGAWAYVSFIGSDPRIAAALIGVQIVIIAVVTRSVTRIGEHIVSDWPLAAIAVGALAATLLGVPFWLVLVAGGGVYALLGRPWLAALVIAVAIVSATLINGTAIALPGGATTQTAATAAVSTGPLFIAGLKGGLLTFGGAYTAIPYVRADTVGRGWIVDGTFLDGVALANMIPAPLVIFATFAGYVAGGLPGALAITAGMFLPAFAFSLIFFERLEAVVENPALHRLLTGIAAAVVGIIVATIIDLSTSVLERLTQPTIAAAVFALALAAAWRLKGAWITPAIIGAGIVVGAAFRL
jgi:chromate transporter